MLRVELPALIGRLNAITRQGLEQAAGHCVEQQAAEINVSHLLLALLEQPLCDVRCLLDSQEIEVTALRAALVEDSVVQADLTVATPSFSPLLVELLQDAWLLATTELEHRHLRSGVVLTTLLHAAPRYLGPRSTALFAPLNRESLRRDFERLTRDSVEAPHTDQDPSSSAQPAMARADSNDALARFTISLTEQARNGRLDPVLGRDAEIDQMLDVLGRRRKNNPIVVGDAGVGKSAVVEGLALRIVAGEVPSTLTDIELLTLDLGALQAGASVKGEFEKRLRAVIDAVRNAPRPTLLFVDEAHTLIGAGNQEGGADAANLLKPALARGELRMIAATTWREYKKYIDKDPALSRRFQPITLTEPSTEQALLILRGLRDVYERSHGVLIGESGLRAAAQLSARYLAGRRLPDKAIDVLDTACARLSQTLDTPPRQLSHLRSEHLALAREREHLDREVLLGRDIQHDDNFDARYSRISEQLDALEEAWRAQRQCVDTILTLQTRLLDSADAVDGGSENRVGDAEATTEHDHDRLRSELKGHEQRLLALQDEYSLISASVEEAQIAQVIADWTGVPAERMTSDEVTRLTELPGHLSKLIQGQDGAIERLHKHLLTARADLRRPGRPLGAFLLVGPSGVGKTESVIKITERLYGGREFLTTLNMSEYQEKHSLSRLIGSPPGYVGFGEGGLLSEAIRQRPYSVVLLDEAEKAHIDVLNLFYQAFDKGEMADGEGRLVDCRNVLFFLTSNLGFEAIVTHADNPAALDDTLYPQLAAFFKPALLARMEVVPYLPLSAATLEAIVSTKLATLSERIRHRYRGAVVTLGEGLAQAICARATRSENGARMLESVIDGELLPSVSQALLERHSRNEAISSVILGVDAHGHFSAEVA